MSGRIKILAESSVPYLRGVLEHLGEVTYLPSSEFTPETVRDKDWLIIRSITKCTASLLEGSSVKLITTATIGFDHIDTAYCDANGIAWRNSPGCNANAVAHFLSSALALYALHSGYDLKGKTMGIVGVGHVGSLMAKYAEALGMKVLLNDPPRAEKEGKQGFVELERLYAEADIISFHTPLTKEGRYATYHLFDSSSLPLIGRKPIVINACRGAVTETEALLEGIRTGQISNVIIDCWENEPNISDRLLAEALIATPHVAGFSADGKCNGAVACVKNGFDFFGLDGAHLIKQMTPPPPADETITLDANDPDAILHALLRTLDLTEIDRRMKEKRMPFEQQRKAYFYPREPHAYTVVSREMSADVEEKLRSIGFKTLSEPV